MGLDILILIGLTLLPFLELRASIPYGILQTDLHWTVVFLVAVVTNIILGPTIYLFLDKAIHLFIRVDWIHSIYTKVVERSQRRLKKSVNRWGNIGVALFIGVPLPGSGSYSGALGAYFLGLGHRRFFYANMVGVILAGVAVLLVSISGSELFSIFIKHF